MTEVGAWTIWVSVGGTCVFICGKVARCGFEVPCDAGKGTAGAGVEV